MDVRPQRVTLRCATVLECDCTQTAIRPDVFRYHNTLPCLINPSCRMEAPTLAYVCQSLFSIRDLQPWESLMEHTKCCRHAAKQANRRRDFIAFMIECNDETTQLAIDRRLSF